MALLIQILINKRVAGFFLLLTLWQISTAQNALENPYEIKSEGEMPQTLKTILKTTNDEWIKYLWHSGKIVYGSPINHYLDKILDNLLINEPALKKELTLLVVKSPIVNAYANAKGILIVNVGLIAQVSNEAELAFVLAHEMIHYVQRHSYVQHSKNDNMNRLLQRHFGSREQENEADVKGIERFYAVSGYNYAAIDGAFDVLQYGHLPFDNIFFERNFVENSCYQFPDKYFLQNTNPIKNRDDYLDTLCTHPNIAKRRTSVKTITDALNNTNRTFFMQPESLFYQIRNIARAECIDQWLIKHEFAKVYYNAYTLLKADSTAQLQYGRFLENAIAVALYGMSKHRTQGSLRNILGKISDLEGEQHGALHFLNELSRQEFNALALRRLWIAKQNSPHNIIFANMCKDLVVDMVKNFKFTLNDFCDYPMGTNVDSIPNEPQKEQPVSGNKYDRIKQTTITKVKPSTNFKTINYMLVDLKQDSAFLAFMQQQFNNIEDDVVLSQLTHSQQSDITDGKLLFMNPYYVYLNKKGYSESKSKKGEQATRRTLTKTSKKLKMTHAFLNDRDTLLQYDVDQYNAYCQLYHWIEYIYHIKQHIEPYFVPDIISIAPDSKYLAVVSTVIEVRRLINYSKIQDLLLSALCVPIIPAFIAHTCLPFYDAQTYFSVINLKNGKVVYSSQYQISHASNVESLTHAFLYDCLYSMKKGELKK